MLYTFIEDSLHKIPNRDRFKLVYEAVKLAKSAPADITDKPVVWALKTIASQSDSPLKAATID